MKKDQLTRMREAELLDEVERQRVKQRKALRIIRGMTLLLTVMSLLDIPKLFTDPRIIRVPFFEVKILVAFIGAWASFCWHRWETFFLRVSVEGRHATAQRGFEAPRSSVSSSK